MKYLLLFTLLLVGCTDAKICEMYKGAYAFYGNNSIECNHHGFVRAENKFKIGDCVTFYVVQEVHDGKGNQMAPYCIITDQVSKIIDVDGNKYYTMSKGDRQMDLRRAEYIDANYVKTSCDGYR